LGGPTVLMVQENTPPGTPIALLKADDPVLLDSLLQE